MVKKSGGGESRGGYEGMDMNDLIQSDYSNPEEVCFKKSRQTKPCRDLHQGQRFDRYLVCQDIFQSCWYLQDGDRVVWWAHAHSFPTSLANLPLETIYAVWRLPSRPIKPESWLEPHVAQCALLFTFRLPRRLLLSPTSSLFNRSFANGSKWAGNWTLPAKIFS